MASQKHPFDLLISMQQQSIQNAKGLPQQVETHSLWSGIGFRIGDITMVAPLTQVNEILHYPKLTLVPGTQSWIKGLANIRGTLLPVMDLQAYLGQPPMHLSALSRVLIIQQGELNSGLLVDEVMGLRHFEPDNRVTRIRKMDTGTKAYIRGAFEQDGRTWHLFDVSSLSQNPQFYKVAV